jgi:predicted nucleic acid-binding protein
MSLAEQQALAAELLKSFDNPAIRWVTFERDDENDQWLMRRFTKVPENGGDPFRTERKPPAEVSELVERLRPALALLPIECRDTPDYAEATGPEFQAMTMRPDAFLALNSLPATLDALATRDADLAALRREVEGLRKEVLERTPYTPDEIEVFQCCFERGWTIEELLAVPRAERPAHARAFLARTAHGVSDEG